MAEDMNTPTKLRASARRLTMFEQPSTPRRSARKSVRPLQDYEEIVNHKSTTDEDPVRWTPAKVGRVSNRRGRKSRKNKKIDESQIDAFKECDNVDIQENDKHEETNNLVEVKKVKEKKTKKISIVTIEESPSREECFEMPRLVSGNLEHMDYNEDSNSNPEKECISNKVHVHHITADDENPTSNITVDESVIMINSSSEVATPSVRRPSGYRFPTPYKSKDSLNLSFTIADGTKSDHLPKAEEDVVHFPISGNLPEEDNGYGLLTTLDPKEIVLQGIRKRSLSVTIGESKRKNVRFHSPANMVEEINKIDKQLCSKGSEHNSESMIKRGKRSSSLDERELEQNETVQLLRQIHFNSQRNRTPVNNKKTISRTKLPNFAAIHQKSFKQMESITDHVMRKAERAKAITNSTTKAGPPSSQKKMPVRNNNLREDNGKLKVRQKINLSNTPSKVAGNFFKENKPDYSKLHLEPANMSKSTTLSKASKLPTLKKKLDEDSGYKTRSRLQANNSLIPLARAENRLNKSVAYVAPLRPRFNLSTAIEKPSFHNITLSAKEMLNQTADKMVDRRKRHEDMYKSRATKVDGRERRDEILRGVRKNRRFELQMMCRNNASKAEK